MRLRYTFLNRNATFSPKKSKRLWKSNLSQKSEPVATGRHRGPTSPSRLAGRNQQEGSTPHRDRKDACSRHMRHLHPAVHPFLCQGVLKRSAFSISSIFCCDQSRFWTGRVMRQSYRSNHCFFSGIASLGPLFTEAFGGSAGRKNFCWLKS